MENYKKYDNLYIYRGMAKKLVVFAFMAVFMSYCPQFWGSGLIYKAHDTLYIFERYD
jgi:hypothetical protein